MKSIYKIFFVASALTSLCACAPPPSAVQVTVNQQFSSQEFRYFKAAELGAWNEKNQYDPALSKTFGTMLYQHSYSYPTYTYFYQTDGLTNAYGATLTAKMQKEITDTGNFTPATRNILAKTSAPFAYITWVKMVSDTTNQYQDIYTDSHYSLKKQKVEYTDYPVSHSARSMLMTAYVYNIAQKSIIWEASLTVTVNHYYQDDANAVKYNAGDVPPYASTNHYPAYPSDDETLHYAFKALAVNFYDQKLLPQTKSVATT